MDRSGVINRVSDINEYLAAHDRRSYIRYRYIVRLTYLHLSGFPKLLRRSNDFRYRRALTLALLYTNRLRSYDVRHKFISASCDIDKERVIRNVVGAMLDGLIQCIRSEIAATLVLNDGGKSQLDSCDRAIVMQIPALQEYKIYGSGSIRVAAADLGMRKVIWCVAAGSVNFFSLLAGTGCYINRYRHVKLVELQNNSTPVCLPYLSILSRWGELWSEGLSAFNSYSVALRSYGLLENGAGDSQNSYGLTHTIHTGKNCDVIKKRTVVKTKVLIPEPRKQEFSLMKRTLVYCPTPPKNQGEALSDFECFMMNLSDIQALCQKMNIRLVLKWKRTPDETVKCLESQEKVLFDHIIDNNKDILRVGLLEDTLLFEQPTWVVANPFSSCLIEADLVMKGLKSCYYNSFSLCSTEYFSDHSCIFGLQELESFIGT